MVEYHKDTWTWIRDDPRIVNPVLTIQSRVFLLVTRTIHLLRVGGVLGGGIPAH